MKVYRILILTGMSIINNLVNQITLGSTFQHFLFGSLSEQGE